MTFAEFFQGREEWKQCTVWCDRAMLLAKKGLLLPAAASSPVAVSKDNIAEDGTGEGSALPGGSPLASPSLVANLLTLRGAFHVSSLSSRQK